MGMRSWQIACVLLTLTSACSKRKLHWSGTRATEITGGGFVVPIPAGWRDGAEATDDDIRKVLGAQPGAHGLVREDFDGATIVIKAGDNPPTTDPPCDEIATAVAKQEGATSSALQKTTVEGDAVCQWTYTKGDVVGDYWMRFHADKLIAIMCFAKGDKANDEACAQTRKGMHLAP